MTHATLAQLLVLQSGGPRAGHAAVAFLADVGPFVRERVRRELRKRLVRGPTGGDDLAAVDDVTADVSHALLRLKGVNRSCGGGQFVARRGVGGVAGLERWLSRIVANAVANHCRRFRGAGRRMKIRATTDLAMNPTFGNGSPLDRVPAKFARPDLLPILEACIAELPEDLRQLVRLKLDEGLALRGAARRVGTSPTTVFRGLQQAYALLRPLLEARGIDASWFGDQAA